MPFFRRTGKKQPVEVEENKDNYPFSFYAYCRKLTWALDKYNFEHGNLRVRFLDGPIFDENGNVKTTEESKSGIIPMLVRLRGIYMIPSDKDLSDYGGDVNSESFRTQASLVRVLYDDDNYYFHNMIGYGWEGLCMCKIDGERICTIEEHEETMYRHAERFYNDNFESIQKAALELWPMSERLNTDVRPRRSVDIIPFEDLIKEINSR